MDRYLIYISSRRPARGHYETLSPSSVFRVQRPESGTGMTTVIGILCGGDSSSYLDMDPGAPELDQFDRNWLLEGHLQQRKTNTN